MTTKTKRRLPILITTILVLVSILTATFASVISGATGKSLGESPYINEYNGNLKVDMTQYYDGTVIQKLPSGIKDTDELSLIIQIGGDSLLDVYEDMNTTQSFSEFFLTEDAEYIRNGAKQDIAAAIEEIAGTGISFSTGVIYSTVFNGFELIVKAEDFLTVCKTLDDANVIVGEVYNAAETKLVENNVNAFDTGIFDTTGFGYDGTGMVVAVLDTGTDYYHSAFSMQNFTAPENKWGLTKAEVAKYLAEKNLAAEGIESGLSQSQSTDRIIEALKKPENKVDLFGNVLSADDVYISGKLPYGYDYADGDSDVYPINNHHGTHVAGIIAGKDNTITGVAPNAQIVTMKIFSDVESSARTSWILAALEDCVALEVDVINMSIGTACGFSRETDKEQVSGVYDRIRALGINMVVAASNSFNSAYSSEKNGNLPLTSNPDSATVGSPSTYEGAMSVASIEGAKTSYILFGGTIIYFEESTNRVSEEKKFVEEVLGDKKELEIEYVLIPGAGLEADYMGIDVTGKVALIKRGSNTFEEKANIAEKKGAAAAIIYNNVSGDIKMNVGETKIPVCSISQNDGELLAATSTGKIKVSKSQAAGPFMSDFSSWGPTPTLGIKPEITAHGGSILSAVPGQDYDRISGTSMATPNITGVTTLLRQYVVNKFYGGKANNELTSAEKIEIAAMINRLMMSTADIVLNKNGNPYAVRKQGAGLANLVNAANTSAYILTYRADGSVMDKSKIELGDDPSKTGVYTLVFTVDNFGSTTLSYDVSALVMTEGVSETKTNQGETTVTETAYMLGAGVTITKVDGGSQSGNKITVAGGTKATVTLTITLTDADKKYLDDSFENGMYVEGFVKLDAEGETVDLSVPYLAFYGDWTKAPIFDLDFYATNKDEIDDGIDLFDKTLADAYPTRPIGGTYDDYVSYLGAYYYEQAPGSKKIAADRKYISLTNQTEGVNSLEYVWAGLLRNVDYVDITITEDSTGEVVYHTVDKDIRKSYGDGGPIRPANIDVGFSAIDKNLKNNTKYTVTLKAYMPYGDGGVANNLNNTFTFPLTTDFQAPVVSGCEFYTEYDKYTDETRLFAKVAIYDNHYSMAMFPGYIGLDDDGAVFNNFDRYLTPIYSEENSTSYVTYELTDFVHEIKKNSYNKNSFAIMLYDYALNISTYEISLPDEYVDLYFEQTELTLSQNEIVDLKPIVYPGTEWSEFVTYRVVSQYGQKDKVRVVNGKLVALIPGTATVIAEGTLKDGTVKQVPLTVKVLGENDDGYKEIDKKPTENFKLTGYFVDKAFYFLSSEERDIGETGNVMKFVGENYNLKMYPSEKITLEWALDAYFDNTTVLFESGDPTKAKVDPKTGTVEIITNEEGYVSVTATVMLDGDATYYSATLNIEIKDPWITSGPSLTAYYGLGGLVQIPDLGITSIGQYAFSNYNYIPKTEDDEISEEVPESTKISYIGDNTITGVIIPDTVESIGPFAFANLTALTSVTIPKSCTTIDYAAFYGCEKLKTVKGIENVKFINRSAFQGCILAGSIDLKNTIAIGDYAFAPLIKYYTDANGYTQPVTYRNAFTSLTLSESCKSVGAYAFLECNSMTTLNIKSDFLKLGNCAFSSCSGLTSVSINAAVIPEGTFEGCTNLASVTIGKDVNLIGESAFGGTKVSSFTVLNGNATYKVVSNASYLVNTDGTKLMLVAPTATTFDAPAQGLTVTEIASGAFSGNRNITKVILPAVTKVGSYAFANCTRLNSITLGSLTDIGDYAFYNTRISGAVDETTFLGSLGNNPIGKYAFALSDISSVNIPDGMKIGEGAFDSCRNLATIKIGDDVEIGKYAFRSATKFEENKVQGDDNFWRYVIDSPITSLTIGKNVNIGESAFWFAAKLESVTLGEGAVIGDYAFYTAPMLKSIDLSKAVSIGKYAFSGNVYNAYTSANGSSTAVVNDNYVYAFYSAKLTAIDLSSATSIGEDAFGYCKDLVSVTLGDKITVIPNGAFRDCEKLSTINLNKVAKIGEYAFTKSAIASANLESAINVGKYAFCESDALSTVTLGALIDTIGEGAFSYCPLLATVNGFENVKTVGDYSFAYTKITSANLSGATYLGTHAFMKESLTRFAVVLGENLKDVGDNPFVYCTLDRFFTTEKESFNGKDYETRVYTFNLSDTVRIIDGSLYKVVPNGLELIVYCADPDNSTVKVADDTVRISAYAFAGADVVNVILPYTLEAIGHKAFYDCDKLALVNFSSYYAPILEEEYDFYYFYDGQSLPIPEEYDEKLSDPARPGKTFHGLGIVDYFMWNVNSDPTGTFFGANFKNYIGKVASKAVMVKPANGVGYDSFVMNQYFDVVLEGNIAADDTTLAAIEAINKIPEKITLADKPLVVAARELYNKIATYEQRSLVDGVIGKLQNAENRIADLEYLEGEGEQPEEPTPEEEKFPVWAIVLIAVGGSLILLGGMGVGAYFLIKYAKRKEEAGELDSPIVRFIAGLLKGKNAAIEPDSAYTESAGESIIEEQIEEIAEPTEEIDETIEDTAEAVDVETEIEIEAEAEIEVEVPIEAETEIETEVASEIETVIETASEDDAEISEENSEDEEN